MLRRLEDRIRELCAKAVETKDTTELYNILEQLTAAMHEQTVRLRNQALNPPVRPERRFSA